jgi:MYXO-CTERM domain-containing protein
MKTKHALAAVTAVGLSFAASQARAADHNMKVSEVGLSKGGDATAQFIELDDPFAEPFPASTYDLGIFDAAGASLGAVPLVSATLAANRTNFLVSTATANTKFGVTGNTLLTVTLPTNGQACFRRNGTTNIHCVAWGTITTLITGADTGASPPDGMSLQRQPSGSYAVATPTPKAVNTVVSTGNDGGTTSDGGIGIDSGTSGGDAGTSGGDAGTKPGTDGGTTAGGDGGDSVNPAAPADDSGCSVANVGDDAASGGFLIVLGALGLVGAARRRKTG